VNTTLQFGQMVVATLASMALALGIDWVLLCAAFRLMGSAPAQWRGNRPLARVHVAARSKEAASQKRAA
jgi:hypothetical protein